VKECKVCGLTKPRSDFYSNKGGRDGLRPECKACNLARRKAKYAENPRPYIERTRRWQSENPERVREYMARFNASGRRKESNRKSHLKRKYGLTLDEFEELLATQGGCAICGNPNADNVDHDHETGRVRGILCFNCNVAVGQMGDSEDRFAAAIGYLARDDELVAVARERAVALTA
jgi:hypothetical protein